MKVKNNEEFIEFSNDNFTGIIEWCDGAEHFAWLSIDYFKNGSYHRENGPAKIWLDGTMEYYLGGIYQGEGTFKKTK
jgi:hypothetical protein